MEKLEFKGTKGEWAVDGDQYLFVDADLNDGVAIGKVTVCQIQTVFRNAEESRANAKLIASAPDLLKALQDLYGAIDSCVDLTPEVLMNAKKAIEKALK